MNDLTRQRAWLEFIGCLPDKGLDAGRLLHAWAMDTIHHIRPPSGQYLWQSPQKTLETGTGDSSAFAVLFYASLRIYGVPAHNLRVAHINGARGPRVACLAQLDGPATVLDCTLDSPAPWQSWDDHVDYMINEDDEWMLSGAYTDTLCAWRAAAAAAMKLYPTHSTAPHTDVMAIVNHH